MAVTLPTHIAAADARRTLPGSVHTFWHERVEPLDRWIVVFAILAPFTNIPQLFKIFVEHKADLSVASWMLYLCFNIPFVLHGLIHKDNVVLFNAALNMVMQITVLIGIGLYS